MLIPCSRFLFAALAVVPVALTATTPRPLPDPITDVPSRTLGTRSPDETPAHASINPIGLIPRPLPARNPTDPNYTRLTNAQRLSRGLPLRKPRFKPKSRYTYKAPLVPRQSSVPCPQVTGTIQVLDGESGEALGYMSNVQNPFGQYAITTSTGYALEVTLHQSCTAPEDPFEIVTLNGNGAPGLEYFGGIVGFHSTSADITPDSPNYVTIGASGSMPPGPAQDAPNGFTAATGIPEGVESAIWTLPDNPSGPAPLVPAWVNTDGARAQGATLVYVPNSYAVALTGDVDAFRAVYGSDVKVVVSDSCFAFR
ncbi:hypothetical protein GY45DRAFT_292141 [Cubamyces sp. BRFM 1775]|nr:hypothetical protein GY45DRAFT_292141 [Cubamyces sp. BRFM 1775]